MDIKLVFPVSRANKHAIKVVTATACAQSPHDKARDRCSVLGHIMLAKHDPCRGEARMCAGQMVVYLTALLFIFSFF